MAVLVTVRKLSITVLMSSYLIPPADKMFQLYTSLDKYSQNGSH